MDTIPEKPKVDIQEIYRLTDQGLSQGAVGRQLQCTQSYISRVLKARRNNGNLPAIPPSQPIAVPSPPIAVPSPSIAADMDELRARVDTLEAFMAAVQAEHRSASPSIAISPSIAAHRDGPWVSRGLQMAPDMLDAIDAYATRHRLEKREVLDLALRSFFTHVGEEVHADG